jgi:hypothetical protein
MTAPAVRITGTSDGEEVAVVLALVTADRAGAANSPQPYRRWRRGRIAALRQRPRYPEPG